MYIVQLNTNELKYAKMVRMHDVRLDRELCFLPCLTKTLLHVVAP
jgi:hypothetical protein